MFSRNLISIGIITLSVLFFSCKEDNPVEEKSIPSLTTTTVSAITQSTASAGGIITSDGGSNITTRGVCWSTNITPTVADNKTTDGSGTGNFTSTITGLLATTTYYVRAYASNSIGTGYGNAISFTTLASSENTVTDIEGNIYRTIKIGNQVWMTENLKTTKFNDGQPIPNVIGVAEWGNLSAPGFSWGNNNPANKDMYGGLYNWFVVNSGKIAPQGWHVPTITEWQILADYLGGAAIAGGKMKSTTRWAPPNTGATNESGFNAYPVDYRNYDGVIMWNPGGMVSYWSSTSIDNSKASGMRLSNDRQSLDGFDYGVNKTYGYSIRCVKD